MRGAPETMVCRILMYMSVIWGPTLGCGHLGPYELQAAARNRPVMVQVLLKALGGVGGTGPRFLRCPWDFGKVPGHFVSLVLQAANF